jgi:hypothetical protein
MRSRIVRLVCLLSFFVTACHLPGAFADTTSGVANPGVEDKIPNGGDPKAWTLLKEAHDARQLLPESVKGFTATLYFLDDEKKFEGKLDFSRAGGVKVDVPGLSDEEKEWLYDKTASFIAHRRGGNFSEGDGKNAITFGPPDQSSYGPLLELHDSLKSTYRVKDGRVTEVTRTQGDTTFTISVFQTYEADQGKYLPKHFVVAYRNNKTHSLEQVDGFRDSYSKSNGMWLPGSRSVLSVSANDKEPRLRKIDLDNIHLSQ